MLLGYEVGDFGVIYEVGFICCGGLPFGGLAGCEQVFYGVKPEFCHAVVRGRVFIAWDVYAVTLDESAEAGDAGTDGTVDVFPVVKELLVGQAGFFRDAISEFDHRCVPLENRNEPKRAGLSIFRQFDLIGEIAAHGKVCYPGNSEQPKDLVAQK